MINSNVLSGKLIFFCIYITRVIGTIRITTHCDGVVSGPLNISCIINPQNSAVKITLPDGITDAASCSAPVPNTICTQLFPYSTVITKQGTEITFVLTIPSLSISTHNGIWTCSNGGETSTGEICVNAPLISEGKEPTFNATEKENLISFIGETYCQHPVSALTFEVFYAEQNGAYTALNPQPFISRKNKSGNGCGAQEKNVTFDGTVSCDKYKDSLAGKTFTLMAKFGQINLPSDRNAFNVTCSSSFSCPDSTEPPGTTTGHSDTCECPALSCLEGYGLCVFWIIIIVVVGFIAVFFILCIVCICKRNKTNAKPSSQAI